MKKIIYLTLALTIMLASCRDDDDVSKWLTPPSSGAEMTLNGGTGGSSAINSVFVDFSASQQDTVRRSSWNLSFNCGSEFGVFLNSTNISRAIEANGIEVGTILSEATLQPYADALAMSMGGSTSMDIVDDFDKSIAGTVIKEGKTYIYRNEDVTQPYYKIKVLKKDNNTYTVAFAKATSDSVATVDVTKDNRYTTIGLSFTASKTVYVENEEWDIVWGRNTYQSAMAAGVPSAMADVVFINSKAGVKGLQILESDISYDDFTESNIDVSALSSDVGVIGANWRGTTGATIVMMVKSDRYYLVQDARGNIYKLKFLTIGGSDGGVRGYPVIKYELIRGV